jgi:hypothetical protein
MAGESYAANGSRRSRRDSSWSHWALALLIFGAYNANGREVGSYDSQPTKFLAIEIAQRHSLSLDRVVARTPAYGERPGFVKGLDGHYRSGYPIAPALLSAAPAWLFSAIGLVDLDTPLASGTFAKLTASSLTTAAVLLAFGIARRMGDRTAAALIALGFGLGTNLWPTASQSLCQHETAVFGIAAALYIFSHAEERLTAGQMTCAFAALGLAGAARPQVAPALVVVALALVRRGGMSRVWTAWPALLTVAAVMILNVSWFGSVLGAMTARESMHLQVHAIRGIVNPTPWWGAAGLLLSPSRGILIFSPVVLVGVVGFWRVFRSEERQEIWPWCAVAVTVQFVVYSAYSVWWGGHTYGPRYLTDVLPFLVPGAAVAMSLISPCPALKATAGALLAWSILVAATGAFCYPADQWNTDPVDVDRRHERLWDWRDPQIVRCWTRGLAPQNWDLFVFAPELLRRR